MIKRLRIRFIFAAALSVFFVLLLTVASINIYNFSSIESRSSQTLSLIVEIRTHPSPEGGEPMGGGPRENILMGEHYYIVEFDADGNVASSDFWHIFSVGETAGIEFARSVYAGTSSFGKSDTMRFKKEAVGNSTFVAVLDLKQKLDEANRFFATSSLISAGAFAVLVLLVVLSSKIVFRTSEISFEKQKSFITNASHELKTPLTIISTDIDLVEMDYGKSEWTDSIRDQVHNLTVMTNQLVTLSKLDERPESYQMASISISDLAQEAADAFAPSFEKQGLVFEAIIADKVETNANQNLLNELLSILLDNALKYAKQPNGRVGLEVKKGNRGETCIDLWNDIETNSAIDPKQMFDRFYRAPDAKKDGSGIGLSIAKMIVGLHKGKISASLQEGRIRISVVL